MRTTLFSTALTLASACTLSELPEAPSYPTEATDTAVIWNGFRHDWGYNHRLNRMGSWVGPLSCAGADCSVELAHAAASGLGSDTATFSTRGTAIHAPGVGFLPGATTLAFDEPRAEGRLLERVQTVTVPLTGLLADRGGYDVLLQGLDVMALEDADMFVALSVEVGPVEVDAAAGTLSFDVTVGLQLDCDALECDGTWDLGGKLRKDVDYGVHVMWLVVGADATDAGMTCEARGGGYTWDDRSLDDELSLDEVTLDGTLSRGALPIAAEATPGALGLQALSIALDDESHLVSLAAGVRPTAADPMRGDMGYALELFFKQWNPMSWDRATSYTTSGRAVTGATVCLLSLADADVAPVATSGSLRWEADGSPATDERAVSRKSVSLPVPAHR